MSTTERSVEEIIGWRPAREHSFSEPTADDLLAWLSKTKGEIELWYTPSETTVCLGEGNHYAPTLLAALEAAVRAVAGGVVSDIADEIAAHLAFQGMIGSDAETLRAVAATIRKVLKKQPAPAQPKPSGGRQSGGGEDAG